MKFTKEEISLCKQVAEKHRKEICKGDCVAIRSYGDLSGKTEYKVKLVNIEFIRGSLVVCFPLWTISDCLEFLREKGFRFILHHYDVREYHLGYGRDDTGQWSDIVPCKTPLEACLKAVLAVLEEGK